MKQSISIYLLLFLILRISAPGYSQSNIDGDCNYEQELAKGIKKFQSGNYGQAIKLFFVAGTCGDKPLLDDLDKWIQPTLNKWEQELKMAEERTQLAVEQAESGEFRVEELTEIAREKEIIAVEALKLVDSLRTEELKSSRKFKASSLAFLANSERANSNSQDALALAYRASQMYELLKEPMDPSVKQAFGNGVLAAMGNTLKLESGILQGGFFPDHQTFYLITRDNNCHLYKVKDDPQKIENAINAELINTLSIHEDLVSSVEISPKGNYCLTVSKDGTAGLWNNNGESLYHFVDSTAPVTAALFSYDEQFVILGNKKGTISFWDLQSKTSTRFIGNLHQQAIQSFQVTENLILAHSYDKVSIIDLRSDEIYEVDHDGALIYTLFLSPNLELMVTASADNTAKVWDTKGIEQQTLEKHKDILSFATFSNGGKQIITCSADTTATVWNLDGEELYTLKGHEDVIRSALFSKDDMNLLTQGNDSKIIMWKENTQKKVIDEHKGRINTLLISPKDDYILSAAAGDQTVRMWDMAGNVYFTKEFSDSPEATISGDGSFIVMYARDGEVTICPNPENILRQFKEGERPSPIISQKVLDEIKAQYNLDFGKN